MLCAAKDSLNAIPHLPELSGHSATNLPTVMKRKPRFLAPRAYAVREEVLAAVVDLQTWASENFDANTTPLDEDGNDPLWGSAFFRERFSTFVYDMGFDARDMTSMELGFLFWVCSVKTKARVIDNS
jgi:hypothetical protein